MDHKKILKNLGQRIRQRRIELGVTQEKLAFAAEIDRSHLANIELGKHNPSFLLLCQLCEALECDLDQFTAGLPSMLNIAKG